MKIVACDCLGISEEWFNQFAVKEKLNIIKTIFPNSNQGYLEFPEENEWDYLIIFEQGMRKFFDNALKFFQIPNTRYIYALDWNSWAEHPAAVYELLNPSREVLAYPLLTLKTLRHFNYFMTCTTHDGMNYIATSKDIAIIQFMYVYNQTWAEVEMNFFHDLAKEFYNVDDSEGLFLDLGANIGTTGIYFTKKIAPNLRLLAFEPDAENFKLLRANLILNDAEKNTVAENYGLGVEESEYNIRKILHNPGGNGLYRGELKSGDAKVNVIPLDKYFAEKNLNPKDVKYIWIDTEGFEAQVLLGAQNILHENPAPIFMEFNPGIYQRQGCYEKWMELLTELYENYVFVQEAINTKNTNVYPIEKLWEYQNTTKQVGDIVLIRKQ